MLEATSPSPTRFIVVAACVVVAVVVFAMYPSQIVPMDPYQAALLDVQRKNHKQDYAEAAKAILQILPLHPQDAELRYQLAVAYRGMGQMDYAATQYLAAISLDANHKGALYDLGYYYASQGQLSGAESMLARLQRMCAAGMACAERDTLSAAVNQLRLRQNYQKPSP